MKKKILMLCMGCFLVSLTAKAQWVVSDPGNLAQGIINAAKNIVHTSSTATNMANSFQETVKIYRQGKEYYDGQGSADHPDGGRYHGHLCHQLRAYAQRPVFYAGRTERDCFGVHQTAGRKCPSAERFEDGGQRERAFHERQGKDGYHRPLLQRHVAKPQSGTVLHQQEHRGVLPARQETERPRPRDGTLRLTERTLLVIIPNPLSLCYCWL